MIRQLSSPISPNESMDRPVTSKPRGICRYYQTERGCFARDKCKFLHGDPDKEPGPLLTPYDKAKTCRYHAAGFCTKGNKCWFLHLSPNGRTTVGREPEDESCSICFEKPPTYGLLSNCNHIFCIDCIRKWRDPKGKSSDVVETGNTKKCPMCRVPSKYIIPSAQFYPDGAEKLLAEGKFKASTAKIKCRYFEQSKQDRSSPALCPFGKDCFYQHINSDGTPHIFSDGVDASMRNYSNRERGSSDLLWTFGSVFLIPDHFPTSSRVNPNNSNTSRGTTTAEESGARFARSLEMLSTAISNNSRLQDLEQTVEAMRSRLETWSAMRNELRNAGIADDEILENIHAADTTNAGGMSRPADPDILGELETMIENHGISNETQGEHGGESRRALLRNDGEVIDRLNNLADYILAAVSSLSPSDNNEPPLIDFESTDDVSDMPALELPSDSEDEYSSGDNDDDWPSSGAEIHRRVEMDLRDLFPVPSRPFDLVPSNTTSPSTLPAPAAETPPNRQPEEDTPSTSITQDPPFLTDGRGRVVWSSTNMSPSDQYDAGATVVSNAEESSNSPIAATNDEGGDTDDEESDLSINPFTLLSRMFGAFFF